MEEFHCHTQAKLAFGQAKGYPFCIEHQRNGGESIFIASFLVDGNAKPCLGPLKENAGEYITWWVENDVHMGNGALLMARIETPTEFYIKSTIHTLLAAGPGTLQGAGLKPPVVCPLCQQQNCELYAYIDDGYRMTHQACLDNRLDIPENDQVQPAKTKGNYALGAVGALLGALLGLTPNWSLAFNNGRISSLFYIFIPVFSAMFYRLFRGKANRIAAALIVLGSSVLAAFLLELVWYWLALTSQMGHNISLAQSTASYFQNHTLMLTVQEMFSSLLFLLGGYIPASILLRKYTGDGELPAKVIRGARLVRASAMPVEQAENEQPPAEQEQNREENLVKQD